MRTQAAQSGRAQSVLGTTAEAANGELPDQDPRIRVNRAIARELMEVLNLDGRRARNIIQYRTIYGTFDGPEELAQVAGITDALIIQWEDNGLLDFH
ncbi:helix-hairpin-helix domain-containing protein [Candidatus Sumerlaeota bacterium]|nr:helix-hairpin-helix domain-containing protein [Candidatus Sumerlaeota bacterium]